VFVAGMGMAERALFLPPTPEAIIPATLT